MNKSNCFSGFDELAGVAAAGLLPEALLLPAAFEPEPEALDFELLFVTLEPVLLDALLVSALFGSETELSAVPLPEKYPVLVSMEPGRQENIVFKKHREQYSPDNNSNSDNGD